MTPAATPQDLPRLYALVPCAGIGERAGAAGPKQYAPLAGRSLVAHTLAALAGVTRLTRTLVVLSPRDDAFETHAPGFDGWVARRGGATRAQTVASGLVELSERGARDRDWVLVHDAARCLVRPEWIDALIDACIDDPVGGLLAQPLADTLKAEHDGRAVSTIARAAKWQAQTPQMFRLKTLRDALASAAVGDIEITDEASAIEAMGLQPRLVACGMENFKVTWPPDFNLAERLLRTRG
jgi:2-C-methyl-D-erythritol 4-phosphate cytidylyltransferase